MNIDAKRSSTKYSQTKSDSTLKRLHNMNKCDLSQGCKDDSANQQILYTISIE
jgi:hypothetical protein